jgi:hypothetical protein
MLITPRSAAVLLLLAAVSQPALGDEVTYENGADGIRYQVTRRTIQRQIPVTEYQPQQQTTYQQQVVTQNVQHQQVYSVPVTQYQVVSRLHGRWNPFVTPYWTHHYAPVTTYQTQVGTVQIPVSRVSWAPVTQTVQAPVTQYRTANEEVVTKVALGPVPGATANTALASKPLSGSPSATISPLQGPPAQTAIASRPLGGEAMQGDPPRQATGWQSPATSRY